MAVSILKNIIVEQQLSEAQTTGQEIRYKVIFNTKVTGGSLAWVTRITASSQSDAVERAKAFFREHRGEFQEAVLHEWNVGTITPLTTMKRPETPYKSRKSK
jgi:hypothetical protein